MQYAMITITPDVRKWHRLLDLMVLRARTFSIDLYRESMIVASFSKGRAEIGSQDVFSDAERAFLLQIQPFFIKAEPITLTNFNPPIDAQKMFFAVTEGSIDILKKATEHFAGQPFTQEWLNKVINDICFYRDDGSKMMQTVTHESMVFLTLKPAEIGWCEIEGIMSPDKV